MATRFDLDMALASQLPLQQETNTNDELTRYLGSSKLFCILSSLAFIKTIHRSDQTV
jgi:hypothetical protein